MRKMLSLVLSIGVSAVAATPNVYSDRILVLEGTLQRIMDIYGRPEKSSQDMPAIVKIAEDAGVTSGMHATGDPREHDSLSGDARKVFELEWFIGQIRHVVGTSQFKDLMFMHEIVGMAENLFGIESSWFKANPALLYTPAETESLSHAAMKINGIVIRPGHNVRIPFRSSRTGFLVAARMASGLVVDRILDPRPLGTYPNSNSYKIHRPGLAKDIFVYEAELDLRHAKFDDDGIEGDGENHCEIFMLDNPAEKKRRK